MNRSIEDKLVSFIKGLGISNYSLYIGWSYFFKKGKEDFFNGKSDVDVVVVIKKINKNINALTSVFDKSVLKAFEKWYFDILNLNYRYGEWRNVYNIKFMSISLFHKIINFEKLDFKSFRQKNLGQFKPNTLFYGNSLIHPYIIHRYKEKKHKDVWYELLYKCSPSKNWVYYLTDLLSMLVFSINLVDNLRINSKLTSSKWYNIVRSSNKGYINNMLRYYIDKWILKLN